MKKLILISLIFQLTLSKVLAVEVVNHGNRNLPEVAITLDADMTPGMVNNLKTGKVKSYYNKKVIDVLNKEKVKATIFLTGMWAEQYPEVSKSLADNSLFEIANHSYSHPGFTRYCFGLPRVPKWGKVAELTKSQDVITKITGVTPKFFRFPGGCYQDSDTELVDKQGLKVVDWDDASGDGFNTNLKGMVSKLKKNTKNGSILVFHLHGNRNAPYSAEVLAIIIPYLKDKGFKLVTMSEMVSHLK